MGAPKGNKFAEGNDGGRPKIFDKPEDLLKACEPYFKWVDENPWYKNEAIKSGDNAGAIVKIPTARPYTLIGLCHYLKINTDTWYEYQKREEFAEITTYIRERIYNQKYEGAAVGAFNANIIARDLGLSDKKEHEHSGEIIWNEEKTYKNDETNV